MKKAWTAVIILFVIIVVGLIALLAIPAPSAQAPAPIATSTPVTSTTPASLDDLIVVTSPLPNTTISSTTISITGKARGNWYFEASAPVSLKNSAGVTIAQGHVTAQGDWMTTDYVPFTASLTFPVQPVGSVGTLVLKNDNPSGDPAKDKELDVPVTF